MTEFVAMVQREIGMQVKTAAIEAEISELEKHRERLVNEIFQSASKADWSRRTTVATITHNPEIVRIDAQIERLQAQQSALKASLPRR